MMFSDHDHRTFHFTFVPSVPADELADTLTLTTIATESLYGAERVALEAQAEFDAKARTVRVRGETEVGRAMATLLLGFLWREFGQAAVTELQRLCGMLKAVRWTGEVVKTFSGQQAVVAECAFLDGVGCGQRDDPAPEEFQRGRDVVLGLVKDHGEQVLAVVVRSERKLASELAIAWAAFGRFCRTRAQVEPETLLSAWKLPGADEVGPLLALCLHDEPDAAAVDDYFQRLSVLWDERIGEMAGGGDRHGR